MTSATNQHMKLADIVAIVVTGFALTLAGCEVPEFDEVLPCNHYTDGACPEGEPCVDGGTCRPNCTADSDCEFCCLSAKDGSRTCAPADRCE